MSQKFLLRVLINAFALFIAVKIVNLEMQNDSVWAFLALGLFFGIANAILKPVMMVAGCPFVILTLGLFTLVINTLLFALVGAVGRSLGIGFIFNDGWFWPSFLGALIVSIVSFLMNIAFKDELKGRKRRSLFD